MTVIGEELTVTGEAIASPVNMLKYVLLGIARQSVLTKNIRD